MDDWKPSKCPECGNKNFDRKPIEERVTVAGVPFIRSMPAIVCSACGESLTPLEDMRSGELAIADWLARRGVRTGEAFRFMRKSLGMRAADLAELLDTTPETISRWERGHIDVDPRAFAMLGELVADRIEGKDDTLQRLRALRAPAKLPKRAVRIELPEAR